MQLLSVFHQEDPGVINREGLIVTRDPYSCLDARATTFQLTQHVNQLNVKLI